MSHIIKRGYVTKYIIGFVIGCVFCIGILALVPMPERSKLYDCGMAEWHPDIPKEVKEECRRLKMLQPGVTI